MRFNLYFIVKFRLEKFLLRFTIKKISIFPNTRKKISKKKFPYFELLENIYKNSIFSISEKKFEFLFFHFLSIKKNQKYILIIFLLD